MRRPTDHVLFGQHAHARAVQPEVVGESLVQVVLTQRPADPFLDLFHGPLVRICKERQETSPVELAHQMCVHNTIIMSMFSELNSAVVVGWTNWLNCSERGAEYRLLIYCAIWRLRRRTSGAREYLAMCTELVNKCGRPTTNTIHNVSI